MPSRQPLRDRCNTLLRVCTDRPSSTKSKLRPNLESSAGNTPPFPPPSVPLLNGASAPPLPLGPPEPLEDLPSPATDTSVREFIPYLYLHTPPIPSAGASASPSSLPALPHTEAWTHAVRILPATAAHPPSSQRVTQATSSRGRQLHILDLYVAVPATAANETSLPLCARHILVARDFLGLALPYYASAHPTADDTDYEDDAPPPQPAARTDPVRVILSGAPRAVLTIALAYIAHAAGSSVAHVMRCVVEEAEDARACALLGSDANMGLGEREMRVLEKLVRREL